MKKIILTFLIMCFSILPCFAEYKPIPKSLSARYKVEMEQIINKECPQAIKNIDNYMQEADRYYQDIITNGYDYLNYTNIVNLSEICIPTADIDLYSDLMKVTQEKYLKIKYTPYATDNIQPFYDYLIPYFKANNVNMEKLLSIRDYKNIKMKALSQYIIKIERIAPN